MGGHSVWFLSPPTFRRILLPLSSWSKNKRSKHQARPISADTACFSCLALLFCLPFIFINEILQERMRRIYNYNLNLLPWEWTASVADYHPSWRPFRLLQILFVDLKVGDHDQSVLPSVNWALPEHQNSLVHQIKVLFQYLLLFL
jgi:hypothetical protein